MEWVSVIVDGNLRYNSPVAPEPMDFHRIAIILLLGITSMKRRAENLNTESETSMTVAERVSRAVSSLREDVGNTKRTIESSNSFYILIIALFEMFAIPAGVIGFGLALYQTNIALNALNDQKIANAWQILAIDAPGNSGKSYALNILAENHEDLVGIDLSCKITDRIYCNDNRRGSIYNVDLRNAKAVINMNLSDSTINGLVFGPYTSNVIINNSSIRGVRFEKSGAGYLMYFQIRNSTIYDMTFEGNFVSELDLTGSRIFGLSFVNNISPVIINISGVKFCTLSFLYNDGTEICTNSLGSDFFKNAYFLKNNPPKDLAEISSDILMNPPCENEIADDSCKGKELIPVGDLISNYYRR